MEGRLILGSGTGRFLWDSICLLDLLFSEVSVLMLMDEVSMYLATDAYWDIACASASVMESDIIPR